MKDLLFAGIVLVVILGLIAMMLMELKHRDDDFRQRCHDAEGAVVGYGSKLCVGPDGMILPVEY